MKVKLNKPYLLCWLAIPPFVYLGFVYRQHSVSIQLHDTYYLISIYHMALLSGLILGLNGLGYWRAIHKKKRLKPVLSLFHLYSTVTILATLTFFDVIFNNIGLGALMVVALLLFLLASQLLYLANILYSSTTSK